MKRVIRIRNLDCAACAMELSDELKEIAGVEEAVVDFVTQRVSLVFSDETAEESETKARYVISHFEEVEIVEAGAPEKKRQASERDRQSCCCDRVLYSRARPFFFRFYQRMGELRAVSCIVRGGGLAGRVDGRHELP